MRAINICYGPITDEYSMLRNGGDLFVETSPGSWVRFADLNAGHPAVSAVNEGSLKAGILASNGETLTTLNAFDPQHRELMKAQGLQIRIPDKSGNSPYLNNQIMQLQQRINKLMQTCDNTRIWLSFSDEIAASIMKDPRHQVLTRKIAKLKKEMQQRKKALGQTDKHDFLHDFRPANVRTNNDDETEFRQANAASKDESYVGNWFQELFRANKDSRKQFTGAA